MFAQKKNCVKEEILVIDLSVSTRKKKVCTKLMKESQLLIFLFPLQVTQKTLC